VTEAWDEEDIDAVRERYLAVLQEQILVPLHTELTARHERMRARMESADSAVRERATGEADRLPMAIALVEDMQARVRHVKLSQLQALLGGPAPTW
jgi:hypothetical protein